MYDGVKMGKYGKNWCYAALIDVVKKIVENLLISLELADILWYAQKDGRET